VSFAKYFLPLPRANCLVDSVASAASVFKTEVFGIAVSLCGTEVSKAGHGGSILMTWV
jgi:hypothetical protein